MSAIKRAFDLILTIPGFIALAPFIMLLTALAAISLGFPVLFSPGKTGAALETLLVAEISDYD